jgi:hypothetical protein
MSSNVHHFLSVFSVFVRFSLRTAPWKSFVVPVITKSQPGITNLKTGHHYGVIMDRIKMAYISSNKWQFFLKFVCVDNRSALTLTFYFLSVFSVFVRFSLRTAPWKSFVVHLSSAHTNYRVTLSVQSEVCICKKVSVSADRYRKFPQPVLMNRKLLQPVISKSQPVITKSQPGITNLKTGHHYGVIMDRIKMDIIIITSGNYKMFHDYIYRN